MNLPIRYVSLREGWWWYTSFFFLLILNISPRPLLPLGPIPLNEWSLYYNEDLVNRNPFDMMWRVIQAHGMQRARHDDWIFIQTSSRLWGVYNWLPCLSGLPWENWPLWILTFSFSRGLRAKSNTLFTKWWQSNFNISQPMIDKSWLAFAAVAFN